MNIYQPDAFAERVTFAARVIGSGREAGRSFSTCFEMGDGDAVIVALSRRVERRPDTRVAAYLYRYLARASVEGLAEQHRGVSDADLPTLAKTQRAGGAE